MNNSYEELCRAIEDHPKNVKLVDKFATRFKKARLYEELIKLYKMAFVYNVEPKYFEKIGDLYTKIENYEEAINYYLNYCESTKPTPKIYYKLADVFEKNNDSESKHACLDFAKKLETEHG